MPTPLPSWRARRTVFIEKPIFRGPATTWNSWALAPGQKAYVAAPMRWCRGLPGAEGAAGQPAAVFRPVICSSYLPGWRPGVDYRQVYSAHKAMGGGVTIDLIHEWDYMVDLFGPPLAYYNFRAPIPTWKSTRTIFRFPLPATPICWQRSIWITLAAPTGAASSFSAGTAP